MTSRNPIPLLIAMLCGVTCAFLAGRHSTGVRVIETPMTAAVRQAEPKIPERPAAVPVPAAPVVKAPERIESKIDLPPVKPADDMVTVIVTRKELPVGTYLNENELEALLTEVRLPKASLPSDLLNDMAELKGRKLSRTLKTGNFFSAGDLAVEPKINMPEGTLKYAIKWDRPTNVYPGDRVDVLLTQLLPDGKARSTRFLTNVLVLDKNINGGDSTSKRSGIIVAVTPQQSLYLLDAEKNGEVKLMPRNPREAN